MVIKAGVWQSLTKQEKLNLLIHFAYFNETSERLRQKNRPVYSKEHKGLEKKN